MKKKLSLILALAMAFSLCACGAKTDTAQTQQPQEQMTTIRVGAMTGPTAMGMFFATRARAMK